MGFRENCDTVREYEGRYVQCEHSDGTSNGVVYEGSFYEIEWTKEMGELKKIGLNRHIHLCKHISKVTDFTRHASPLIKSILESLENDQSEVVIRIPLKR